MNSPWQVARLVTILVLGIVVVAGLLIIRQGVLGAWHQDRQEYALYQWSPGCSPGAGAAATQDGSLPPCRDVTVKVVGKSAQDVSSYSRYGNTLTRTFRSLGVQAAGEQTYTISPVSRSLWESVVQGQAVTAQVWQGRVTPPPPAA